MIFSHGLCLVSTITPVYLCNVAGPQEMDDYIKDFYGKMWLGISVCL